MEAIVFNGVKVEAPCQYRHDVAVLIDDNRMDLLHGKTMLKKNNFAKKIITFNSGKMAISFFNKALHKGLFQCVSDPIVVFADLYMPQMNGFEFIEQFERLDNNFYKNFKIYILTNSTNPLDLMRAQRYKSIFGFFQKTPVNTKLFEL